MTTPLARLRPGSRPCPEPDPGLLTGTPWSVRLAGGLGTRPAVEIYEAGSLAGLIVATHVTPQILAGPVAPSATARPMPSPGAGLLKAAR